MASEMKSELPTGGFDNSYFLNAAHHSLQVPHVCESAVRRMKISWHKGTLSGRHGKNQTIISQVTALAALMQRAAAGTKPDYLSVNVNFRFFLLSAL